MSTRNKKDLLEFLFGTSQVTESQETLADDVAEALESAQAQERLTQKKSPLKAALKKLGADVDGLEFDPDGFSLTTADADEHRKLKRLFTAPDSLYQLAELGWVVADCGDGAMTAEEPQYRFRFIEIIADEPENSDKPADLNKMAQDAYKFINPPAEERDNDLPSKAAIKAEAGGKATRAFKLKKVNTTEAVHDLVSKLLD